MGAFKVFLSLMCFSSYHFTDSDGKSVNRENDMIESFHIMRNKRLLKCRRKGDGIQLHYFVKLI